MARKKKSRKQGGSAGLIAALLVGGVGAVAGLLALGRRSREAGRGQAIADGGSTAADLGRDQPHHGPGDRAPTDFRPDPTAPVMDRKRDAFAPATLPNPKRAQPIV